MFWGLSESLDLYEEYLKALKGLAEQDTADATTNKTDNPEQQNDGQQENNLPQCDESIENSDNLPPPPRKLNILLVGAGDPRHIIHTMAKLYKHKAADAAAQAIELNFFMLDSCMEVVARHMALLSIALEQPDLLNLHAKVHLFMDVYGNSMLRPSTHQYLVSKAKSLLSICTDDEIRQRIAPMLSIDGLKYRERDQLEMSFNFWLPKEGNIFNIQKYWEARNRKLLTVRYDFRDGAFDWDLNMVLKDRGAQQICSQEYRHWRECGIAFTYPEYEQCKPNKTLALALQRNGDRFLHCGYVGDIQSGPFCCYGIKCSDARMLHSQHGDNDYRATDITERNLLEHFYELHEQQPYEHDLEHSRRYGSVKLLMGKTLQWNECDMDAVANYNKPWLSMPNLHVHFLSQENMQEMLQNPNERWHNFFDIAFVGYNFFQFLKDGFGNLMREHALLILETKLLTVARREEVTAFETKLKDFAKTINLTPVINYGAINAKFSLLKFKKVAAKE